jgi:hypothetical protein
LTREIDVVELAEIRLHRAVSRTRRQRQSRASEILAATIGEDEQSLVLGMSDADRMHWLVAEEESRWIPPVEYWRIVRCVWELAGETASTAADWEDILTRRNESHRFMRCGEITQLRRLPTVVDVYRGHANPDGGGFAPAWTTALTEAERCAEEQAAALGGAPVIEHGTVPRNRIIGYSSTRDVIVCPGDVAGRLPLGCVPLDWRDMPKVTRHGRVPIVAPAQARAALCA